MASIRSTLVSLMTLALFGVTASAQNCSCSVESYTTASELSYTPVAYNPTPTESAIPAPASNRTGAEPSYYVNAGPALQNGDALYGSVAVAVVVAAAAAMA
ncbi:MAG: hypothetical protein M1817_003616 [Caeruleum heppii]|nr:MAG: hypothetical protein M1817_003616 [Caeruleum heppii]